MNQQLAIIENDTIVTSFSPGDEIPIQFALSLGNTAKKILGDKVKRVYKSVADRMLEKCDVHSYEKCNACYYDNIDYKKNCLLRLFSFYTGRIPQPHHGHELYDVELKIPLLGEKTLKGVIFLKNIQANLTQSNNSSLINQLTKIIDNQQIEIFGFLAKTNHELKDTIEKLCRGFKKYYFFIEEEDLVMLLEQRSQNDSFYEIVDQQIDIQRGNKCQN